MFTFSSMEYSDANATAGKSRGAAIRWLSANQAKPAGKHQDSIISSSKTLGKDGVTLTKHGLECSCLSLLQKQSVCTKTPWHRGFVHEQF